MFKDAPSFSSFSVDDLSKARDFYSRILGLEVTDNEEGIDIHTGGRKIFVYPKTNHAPATFTILIFPVPDINKAVDELMGKGVQFEHYDSREIKTDEKGIARRDGTDGMGPSAAWFKDPAGNFISVIEETS